ncbi:hypothetical protein HMPREF1870_02343 [Bacteroidales bacterium KA00344]|nr:hypothetical protein HMPREF1870_02343 [Bacteroidales bacterium KA00344]
MIAMRKLLIYYLVISFLLVIVYALFVINAYVSIKYEVETLYNDVIVSMIYQIFDTGIIVNFIGLVINMLIVISLYMKIRCIKNKKEQKS